MVVGADRRDRSSYRLWEEPKGPDFALEITSRRTHREDQGKKRELYRRLEVREYWQYDPTSDYLQPALQGLVLEAEKYRRLPGTELADGTLALASEVLGLGLRLTERGLRFHDPETGRELPDLAETDAAVEQAEQARQRELQSRQRAEQAQQRELQSRQDAERRLAREAAARKKAEARVAELEALLRQARGGDPERDG